MAYCTKCGIEVDENSNFCQSCGTPVGEQLERTYNADEQTYLQEYYESASASDSSKRYLWIAVLLGIIAVLFFTNPDKEKHIDVLQTKISELLSEKADDKVSATMTASLGGSIAKKVLESQLRIDDYYLFSLGKIKDKDTSKTVSFGILGMVFTSELDENAFNDFK